MKIGGWNLVMLFKPVFLKLDFLSFPIWGFPEVGVPQIISFFMAFSTINHQFGGTPIYGNPPFICFFSLWVGCIIFDPVFEGGNPVLALLLGLSLGTSSCNWRMLCPLLMMMLGVLATIHGELSLSYLGLALLVMAILIEQFLGEISRLVGM